MNRVLFIFLSLILTACSLTKTADQMKEATNQIKTDSDQLAKRTDDLEDELTFKESSLMMLEAMRWLWGEGDHGSTATALAPTETDTFVYAGVVIKSMWFQFWKGDFHENMASLDERFELGAEILLARVKAHSDFSHSVNFWALPDSSFQGAGALAAKLDFVRPEFQRALQRLGEPEMNFYDLIVLALQARNSVEPSTRFPRAVAKILEFGGEATYLLQLRHNFLPLMMTASMTDFKDLNVANRLLKSWTKTEVDLSAFNPTQLREWTRWLRMAKQTRADLTAMGIKPEINSKIQRIQEHLDFGQARLLAPGAHALDARAKLQRDLASAFKDLQ